MLTYDNFVILIENILFVLYCGQFFRRRWKNKYSFLLLMMAQWGIQYAFTSASTMRQTHNAIVFMLLDTVILFGFFTDNKRVSRILKKVFFLILYYVVTGGIQAILINISIRISGADYLHEQDLQLHPSGAHIKTYALFLLVCVFLLLLLERFRHVDMIDISVFSWLVLLALPVCSFAIVAFMYPYGQDEVTETTRTLLSYVSLFIVGQNIFMYVVHRYVVSTTAERYELKNVKLLQEAITIYVEQQSLAMKQLHAVMHEYRKQLRFIYSLISQGYLNEAIDYIKELLSGIDDAEFKTISGNQFIDIILNSQVVLLQEAGLECDFQCSIPSEMPDFAIGDIHTIIGNAFENAIEACKLQGLAGKVINAKILLNNDSFLTISIKNPINKELRQKAANDTKGQGLNIIRCVVNLYDGNVETLIEDGVFHLSVMLQNKKTYNTNNRKLIKK